MRAADGGLTRRGLIAAMVASASACRRSSPPAPSVGSAPSAGAAPPAGEATAVRAAEEVPVGPTASSSSAPKTARAGLLDWTFEGASAAGGAERAVVIVPPGAEGERFPVLVALHGRGEATRGAEAGAYGWVRDYHLQAGLAALGRGSLRADDFQGLVKDERLVAINASLAERAYGGLIVVCPHTPDLWAPARRDLDAAAPFGRWVVEVLLAKVRTECPTLEGQVGVDGVSLGGRVSFLIGTDHPETFRAVGTLQPAYQQSDIPALTKRARAYLRGRPGGRLRLLSSDGDYFKPVVAALHEAFTSAGVAHDYAVVPGPHDYVFNRGPGGLEMLLWHDRVLRGLAPV